eukprot:g3508.t1
MLLWGEEELLHSEHWSMDQRKSMAIALRDWAITALICAVDERLACGARAVRFTGLLERFIFYDRDSKASNAQSSRLLGGLTKARDPRPWWWLCKRVREEDEEVKHTMNAYDRDLL